jgi:hypothetical protein
MIGIADPCNDGVEIVSLLPFSLFSPPRIADNLGVDNFMIFNVDVLRPIVVLWILRKLDCPLIVR